MLKDEIEAIREANRKTENYFSDQGYLADEVDEKEWRKVKN